MTQLKIAVFRPVGERINAAKEYLESKNVKPVADPMLETVATGQIPPEGKDILIITSPTGAPILGQSDWSQGKTTLCAIGEQTAAALTESGYNVDIVPETASSKGIVQELATIAADKTVIIARSAHGSDTLPKGLRQAGADVSETILYELQRPENSGYSTEYAAAGKLDGCLFTSSKTVLHFLGAARERGIETETISGINNAVVGAIGQPTAKTATDQSIDVDVIPNETSFEQLADETIATIRNRSETS
ncbi:MAG: uroporphyrinogen-III synthase [Halobacteriaceae archaeon]